MRRAQAIGVGAWLWAVCALAACGEDGAAVSAGEGTRPGPQDGAASSGAATAPHGSSSSSSGTPPSGSSSSSGAAPDPHGGSSSSGAAQPVFDGVAEPLDAALRARMTGRSWRAGCPVGLDQLSLLRMPHWGFDGAVHRGEMVVASRVADDVLSAFAAMFAAAFPIERMQLVDDFEADDDASMAANNSSAFNCRKITGGSSYSAHSYGAAIDLNPVQNPYVRGNAIYPPAGSGYTDRSAVAPGMIAAGSAPHTAFTALGWGWGGSWSSLKDYQHFSEDNR